MINLKYMFFFSVYVYTLYGRKSNARHGRDSLINTAILFYSYRRVCVSAASTTGTSYGWCFLPSYSKGKTRKKEKKKEEKNKGKTKQKVKKKFDEHSREIRSKRE